jgi:hypothetical protein
MGESLVWLVILSLPVACVSWTITHEEVFRDPRQWLSERSRTCRHLWQRKLCYMLTCEYCLAHYLAAGFIALTGFQLLLSDWRGYLLSWLAAVAVANVYMSAYSRLRVEIHKEQAEARQNRNPQSPRRLGVAVPLTPFAPASRKGVGVRGRGSGDLPSHPRSTDGCALRAPGASDCICSTSRTAGCARMTSVYSVMNAAFQ